MSLRTSISILALILLGTGCTGRRGIEQTPPPSWVEERPVSNLHYIGIGSATPNPIPGEALRTAKERAAADLVGEIALRVESTSLLESEERNGQVREDFTNTISSRAEERIAGFQVVDVWEGPQGTYVYYRLDKARYAAERQARRQEAIDLALLEHEAGKQDLASGNIQGALDHWGAGVLGLEEFWNEVNR
ncbi:MAG: LPP20 family lipoprotein, partial [Bacteroidota bacterium]|nr:LPP20 family lipoprotein [Bacteroidota bacterium]